MSKTSQLPPLTRAFLRTKAGRQRKALVVKFHRWMDEQQLTLETLTPANVVTFSRHRMSRVRSVKPRTWYHRRTRLLVYLHWLKANDALSFDPRCLWAAKVLPSLPNQFLGSLTTLKTNHHYRCTLRAFYTWMDDNTLCVAKLNRAHVLRWFRHLEKKKLHPGTRQGHIIRLRLYFRWLYEQGHVDFDPEDLVRSSDLPPRPSVLPRPLPPDADRILQQRLARSSCLYQQGLLLMRNTGVRIGELIALERQCVRTDPQGNRFLKVPLGKLNSERLVPVDLDTFVLIQKLQRRGPRQRIHLIDFPVQPHIQQCHYNQALRRACEGLEIPGKVTTHRLRHTYATTLLNGGMSLVGIMRLLGHRHIGMTLRYTAIVQDTLVDEYQRALIQSAKKYDATVRRPETQDFNPNKLLSDLIRWLANRFGDDPATKRHVRPLIKRITRIQTAVHRLLPNDPQPSSDGHIGQV